MTAGCEPNARGTGSLRKALRLIAGLAESDQRGLRLTEIVGRSNVDPATAYRLLSCLVAEDFVQKQPDKRYRLGRRVFEIGLVAAQSFTERDQAHDALRRLATTVGAAAVLSVRSGDETVYIDRVEGPERFPSLRSGLGTRLPLGIGAGGIALLAAMEPGEVDTVLAANAVRYRKFGTQASALVRRRVAEAKHRGFAITHSFLQPGVSAMGVTIPSEGVAPDLAISLVSRAGRLESAQACELSRAASEIAQAMCLDEDGQLRPG